MVALPRLCEKCGYSMYHYGPCACAPPPSDPRDAENARLRAALAEALPFLPDAHSTDAPAVADWHRRHATAIRTAAESAGRAHLLA